MKWRKVTDWIWPTLGPFPDGYRKKIIAKAEEKLRIWTPDECEQHGKQWARQVEKERKEEEERKTRIENKLQWQLRLCSVAVPIILAMAGFLGTLNSNNFTGLSVFVVFAVAIYAEIQLVGAILSLLRGLKVRAYESVGYLEPMNGESEEEHLVRSANKQVVANALNTETTNDRISQLKLAEAFLRNAFVMVGIASLVILVIVAQRTLLSGAG